MKLGPLQFWNFLRRARERTVAGLRKADNQHVRDEFKAAFFVASVVVILNHHHLLDDLQNDTLQLALPILLKFQNILPGAAAHEMQNGDIKVLLIDDLEFETRFQQESPLNRKELKELFSGLLEPDNAPTVLVLDLDLSPGPYPDASRERQDESELYELLKNRAGNTGIVLVTPQPVLSPSLARQKEAWMNEMCDAGIRFGLANIPSVNGLVLKYDNINSSLAAETDRASPRAGAESTSLHEKTICDSKDDLINVTRKFGPGIDDPDSSQDRYELLNYKFVSDFDTYSVSDLCPEYDCGNTDLSGSVVFVGGFYGTSDVYETPAGPLSGVQIHAGGLYSHWHPVKKTNELVVYILEMAFGTLLGWIFYSLATLYRNSRSIGSIVINVVMQPAAALAFVLIAGLLLQFHNLWLNPAPMIIGMAIHAEVVRTEEPYVKIDSKAKFLGIPEKWIKFAVYFGFILWSWGLLARSLLDH